MKNMMQKAVILLVYLFALLYVTDFKWKNMFDATGFGMVLLGMVLLTIPQWLQIVKQQRKSKEKVKLPFSIYFAPCSGNALFASYLTAAVTLLANLSGKVQLEQIAERIALGCRPMLYGLLFYVLFHGTEDDEYDKIEETAEKLSAVSVDSKKQTLSLSADQLCYFFRARGLTAREAEVARLLYTGYSNREIAAELYITESTVKKHVTHIMEKLEIKQREQIVEVMEQKF